MKSIKVLIFSVFCLATCTTIAQTAKKHILDKATKSTKNLFSENDSNKDSFISKAEIKSSNEHLMHFRKNFNKIDTNKDGKISIEECKQHKVKNIGVIERKLKKELTAESINFGVPLKRFKLLDVNKDEVISQSEFFNRKIMLSDDYTLKNIDLNKDNNISFKEFKKHFKSWLNLSDKNKPRLPQQKKQREVYVPKPRFNYEKLTVEELFKKFDTSANNQIEREEAKLENSFNTDFSRMDVNGDEIVNKKELTKHLDKLKK